MFKVLRTHLSKSSTIVSIYDRIREVYYGNIADEILIRKRFKERVGREVDLYNPIKYNDKLQWLKLNWRDPIATQCADKYAVREFVTERIGAQYLNELIAVYETVNDIDFEQLPNRFVLKVTHGSGFNLICKDKQEINWKEEVKKLKRWQNNNYQLYNREWVYKNISPRIICEKYLEQDDGTELKDFRFFCFNGEPKFIGVDFDIIDKTKTRRNIYDLEWNLLDVEISYPNELSKRVSKPEKLSEMIEISRELSSGFPHARVDLYYVNNRIIFGEITFFHQSGFGRIKPEEFEVEMGNWLELPI